MRVITIRKDVDHEDTEEGGYKDLGYPWHSGPVQDLANYQITYDRHYVGNQIKPKHIGHDLSVQVRYFAADDEKE